MKNTLYKFCFIAIAILVIGFIFYKTYSEVEIAIVYYDNTSIIVSGTDCFTHSDIFNNTYDGKPYLTVSRPIFNSWSDYFNVVCVMLSISIFIVIYGFLFTKRHE